MTVKTAVSRFQIHDELTAPDESAPLIKTIQAAGGAVTKFVGVLAGSPAVLRAYTRMRSELRGGVLPQATRERIALAVAEHREDNYSIAQHAKSARRAGLGLDEVSRARSFTSADEKEAALLALPQGGARRRRPAPAPPPRGGAGDRLDRRGDPRGGRAPRPERVPEPDRERRGAAERPGDPAGPALGGVGERREAEVPQRANGRRRLAARPAAVSASPRPGSRCRAGGRWSSGSRRWRGVPTFSWGSPWRMSVELVQVPGSRLARQTLFGGEVLGEGRGPGRHGDADDVVLFDLQRGAEFDRLAEVGARGP